MRRHSSQVWKLSARFSATALRRFRDSLLAKVTTGTTSSLQSLNKVSRMTNSTCSNVVKLLASGELKNVAIAASDITLTRGR